MNTQQLLQMPVAQRTDYLETVAHAQGLKTAPLGGRNESDILANILSGIVDADPDLLTKSLWAHYFKAPILLYRMILHFHPHLLNISHLRVLYIGADKDEVFDEGRWFSLAWRLLGLSHQKLEIDAVGPDLAHEDDWEESPWAYMVASETPVTILYPETLEETFVLENKVINWENEFNLVVMHHPGFVTNWNGWAHDAAFADLAGFANIPIVGTSYDPTDYAFDRHGLAVLGRVVDGVYWNSAAHLNPGEIYHNYQSRHFFGQVMWTARLDPVTIENDITPTQLEALHWMETYHPFNTPDLIRENPLFWQYTCPMQFDDLHQSVYVTDDIRIDCATGKITLFDVDIHPNQFSTKIANSPVLEDRLSLLKPFIHHIQSQLKAAMNLRAMSMSSRLKPPAF